MAKAKARPRNAKSDKLTKRQEDFARAYVKTGNATEAYRQAYTVSGMTPKSVNEEACHTLAIPKISSRIDALRAPGLAKAGLTIERTLREVSHISHVDPRRFYRPDGTMKEPGEWDDDMAAAVSSIEATPILIKTEEGEQRLGYTYKIKFWDKNAGLEKSMKHLGLFERDNAQTRENLVLHVEAAVPVKR